MRDLYLTHRIGFATTKENEIVSASKWEALTLIDHQCELMALYSQKYNGKYNVWSVIKAF